MELKRLVKHTSFLIVSKIFTLLANLIKTKIAALLLGTSGVGVINQFVFTTQKISLFSLLSINHGVVKQMAERKQKENARDEIQNILKSYTIIISVLTIISVLLLLLFRQKLTVYFFGDIKYQVIYIISVCSVPLIIFNSWSNSILRAFKEIKYIARTTIIVSLCSLILFIPLVMIFELTGAIITLVIGFLLILVLNNYYARKKILLNFKLSYSDIMDGKVVRKDINELFLFAGVGITIGLYDIFSETLTRSIVIQNIGIEGIGIYAPNIALGGVFTGFLLPSIFTYLFPRFAEAKSNKEIVGVINDVYRMVSFVALPFVVISISLREFIIPILYTDDFKEASVLLPGHFVGTLFYIYMAVLGQVFSPTNRIKIYGLFQFVVITISIFIVYVFVPKLGLTGYMLKFLIIPFIFFVIFSIYLFKEIQLRIELRNIFLMTYVFAATFISYLVSQYHNVFINAACAVILILILGLFMKQNEKKYLIDKLFNLMKGKM